MGQLKSPNPRAPSSSRADPAPCVPTSVNFWHVTQMAFSGRDRVYVSTLQSPHPVPSGLWGLEERSCWIRNSWHRLNLGKMAVMVLREAKCFKGSAKTAVPRLCSSGALKDSGELGGTRLDKRTPEKFYLFFQVGCLHNHPQIRHLQPSPNTFGSPGGTCSWFLQPQLHTQGPWTHLRRN